MPSLVESTKEELRRQYDPNGRSSRCCCWVLTTIGGTGSPVDSKPSDSSLLSFFDAATPNSKPTFSTPMTLAFTSNSHPLLLTDPRFLNCVVVSPSDGGSGTARISSSVRFL